MKTYLLFSDSHGAGRTMLSVISAQPNVDGILFMGDGLSDLALVAELYPALPIYAVRGNCDWTLHGINSPKEQLIDLFGHKLFLTHGHLYQAKQTLEHLAEKGISLGAEAVLFGHTHTPYDMFCRVQSDGPLIHLFNPGSIGTSATHLACFGLLQIGNQGLLFSHGQAK